MKVSVRGVSKRLGATAVLTEVSLEIRAQELFFLLGPSGCGKTTLLRLLAGFYEPDQGDLFFGDRRMNGVPPHQRNTGLVFQNYALWPHLTVGQNVAYGLQVRHVKGAAQAARVAEALAIVRMEGYADRWPNQLSGGQQQRVALARALVIQPDILLLDEPLSNLDARLRLEMRDEIRRIHQQTRITTLYVTHDQKEALSLADRLAVMCAGRIEQVGEPRAVYRVPRNRFVADFLGEMNWLPAVVQARAGAALSLSTAVGAFDAPAGDGWLVGRKAWLGFRPEAVRIGPGPSNGLATTVLQASYLGEIEQYELELVGGVRIKAVEQNPPVARQAGAALPVHVMPEDLVLAPREE